VLVSLKTDVGKPIEQKVTVIELVAMRPCLSEGEVNLPPKLVCEDSSPVIASAAKQSRAKQKLPA